MCTAYVKSKATPVAKTLALTVAREYPPSTIMGEIVLI
jgi:hypothetical protein